MTNLSERVMALSGPDREVDAEIWRIIHPTSQYRLAPSYTASIDAAMTLVPEGWVLNSLKQTPEAEKNEHTGWEQLPEWSAALLRQDCAGYANRKRFLEAFRHGTAKTAALAICAAALLAREASNGDL